MKKLFPIIALCLFITPSAFAADSADTGKKKRHCDYEIEEGQKMELVVGTVVKSEIMYPNLKCKDDDCSDIWKAVKSTRLVVLDRELPDGTTKQVMAHPPRRIIHEMIEDGSPFEVGGRYAFCAYTRKYKDQWQQKTFGQRLNIDMRTVKSYPAKGE